MDFTRTSLGKNMGFSRERHEKHMGKTWKRHEKTPLHTSCITA